MARTRTRGRGRGRRGQRGQNGQVSAPQQMLSEVESFVTQQRQRLQEERESVLAEQSALQIRLQEIDNEIFALDAYEDARISRADFVAPPARRKLRVAATRARRKPRTGARTRTATRRGRTARAEPATRRTGRPRRAARAKPARPATRRTRRAGLRLIKTTPPGLRRGSKRARALSVIVAEPGLNRAEIRERLGMQEGDDNKVSNMMTALVKTNFVTRENRRYYPVANAAQDALAQLEDAAIA